MATQELMAALEDAASVLRKTQTNLKKCPKARLTKGYIEARIKIVDGYWTSFMNAHQQVVKAIPKEQRAKIPYFVNEEYFVYEDIYNDLQGDLVDMLSTYSQLTGTKSDSSLPIAQSPGTSSVLHLPKIQMPTFSGTYEQWPMFKDLFTSLVHDNSSLSDVQKLHYLKSSITGDAESLLKHVQITSSNYQPAWKVLQARYGNKRLILNSFMKTLYNQKKMSCQSAVQLKSLLDTTTETLNNIKNLDISTDSWDPMLIHLLVQKMDPETHKSWEEHAYRDESEDLPKWDDLKKFMETKFRTLELVTAASTNISRGKQAKEHSFHVATPVAEKICIKCNENHTLSHCKEFVNMEPKERSEYVKTKHLCFNCLVPGHSSVKCRLPVSCRICKRRHHSLLHEYKNQEATEPTNKSQHITLASQHVVEDEDEVVQVNTAIASHISTGQGVALLATAVVEATNEQGHTISLRALIDPGSQATFISEKATQLLNLKKKPMKGNVIGVGSMKTEIKHVVQLQLSSHQDSNSSLNIQAYVMSKQLTTKIPAKTIKSLPWPHLDGIELADPTYDTPGNIDLLLGVKEYAKILLQDLIKGPPGTPCAQRTTLGWILFGDVNAAPREDTYFVMHHQVDVEDLLKSIWEIDTDKDRHLTTQEKLCEEKYNTSTIRNEMGRYIVNLPFKTDSPQSPEGNTKEIARYRFLQLERKLKRSPNLKKEYIKVMNDYITQNHMERVPERERDNEQTVYLPHHAVVRDDKETTKTRVVFDASCKGKNNVSLNDELLVGPTLQDDMRSLLTRWRMKEICFVADIQQMYRQILVTAHDANYQRLFWRPDESEDLEEYRLRTVTFGTSSVPFLAVRTLQQLATDEGKENPKAAQAITDNFYMDDMLDGADTTEEAIVLAKQVTDILQKGGFQLTKWSSNSIEFMNSIEENKRSSNVQVDLNLDGSIKALGVVWNLNKDTLQYKMNLSQSTVTTKRGILSDIQKLFDPLGWIAPSTVMAKMLIQKLWLEKIDWDETISDTLKGEWRKIKTDFIHVNDIQIDRWFHTTKVNKEKIQIHGFSDASMKAYAAVVYIRVETMDHNIETKLIAARTRVAPLKTISLPRLELCGALLLSKLMRDIGRSMRIPTANMYAWTDSSIVIAWLCGEPHRWKPFVANRVVEIVENLNNNHWFHVSTNENPADVASRGMLLSDLRQCEMWWRGPAWLSEKEINIDKHVKIETALEMKSTKLNTYLTVETLSITQQFENFDNLTELIKTITYCKRFLNHRRDQNKLKEELTTQELDDALMTCLKKIQNDEYGAEIERLLLKKQIRKSSSLRSLNPYLDDRGVLRVGGRLRHAQLPDERKNPIIMGNKNPLARLIVADAHQKTLHGGLQLMLCYLRSKYWIVRAKSIVKKCIHKCLICAKLNAVTKAQIMGDLPKERTTPARPFINSGVDFAGPFHILMNKGRGNKTVKAYISIFICMCTKAIHIELVGDLTSEAFIGAFRRFVARRGKCSHLWSDQGRNFVGANKELQDAWNEAKLQFTGEITQSLATDGTQWHFIPAYSPNFGGLWEAGVKSIKYHLKRIVSTHLTYEEMTTVLCQIEACLNSRPLCPLDDTDPDNINPLTPGHFLVGEAPIVVPSPDMGNPKPFKLSRWQHTQKLVNDFWRRWQDEYLSRMQQRPKWCKKEEEFQIGDVVLIKTDNLPPGKWSLGRVVDKHPGADGLTRVYGVRSGGSVTKRTVTKLCALPINNDD